MLHGCTIGTVHRALCKWHRAPCTGAQVAPCVDEVQETRVKRLGQEPRQHGNLFFAVLSANVVLFVLSLVFNDTVDDPFDLFFNFSLQSRKKVYEHEDATDRLLSPSTVPEASKHGSSCHPFGTTCYPWYTAHAQASAILCR